MSLILREQRCQKCEKLLLRGILFSGRLEVRCPRCSTDNIIDGMGGPVEMPDTYSILFDYDGKVVDASENTSAILGYSRDELLTLQRGDFRSDLSPADYQALRSIMMSGIGPVCFDTVHRKKNGEMLSVRLQIRVLVSEQSRFALVIARILGNHSDAGERSPRYEFAVNTNGQFTYVSVATADLLGHRWISLIGQGVDNFFEVAVEPVFPIAAQLTTGRFFHLEKALVRAEKSSGMPLELNFNPRRDVYEETIGYDVVAFPL